MSKHPIINTPIERTTVPCRLCGTSTPMTGTRLCDGCWELERRVLMDPELARSVLANHDHMTRRFALNTDDMALDGSRRCRWYWAQVLISSDIQPYFRGPKGWSKPWPLPATTPDGAFHWIDDPKNRLDPPKEPGS